MRNAHTSRKTGGLRSGAAAVSDPTSGPLEGSDAAGCTNALEAVTGGSGWLVLGVCAGGCEWAGLWSQQHGWSIAARALSAM